MIRMRLIDSSWIPFNLPLRDYHDLFTHGTDDVSFFCLKAIICIDVMAETNIRLFFLGGVELR